MQGDRRDRNRPPAALAVFLTTKDSSALLRRSPYPVDLGLPDCYRRRTNGHEEDDEATHGIRLQMGVRCHCGFRNTTRFLVYPMHLQAHEAWRALEWRRC